MSFYATGAIIFWLILLAISVFGYFNSSRQADIFDRHARRSDGTRGGDDRMIADRRAY